MTEKNKIDWFTIVTIDSGSGGAEQTQLNLITALIEQGKKCSVVILKKSKKNSWKHLEDKCEIIHTPFNWIFISYLYLFPFLFFFFKKNEASYIFSSQTLINSLLGVCKKVGFYESQLIVRESNSIFKLLDGLKLLRYKIAYKIGYSYVDLVICQTSYMKKQLLDAMPWIEKKTKVVVIPNPLNHKDMLQKSKEVIKELQHEDYIVAAGRLVPAKGFDILINSFSKIHEKLNGCKLYILGDGPDKESLIKQIRDNGLDKKIILKGLVPNVYPYFKNAELCVMSSRIEGFPNVLLQMMSQNTKVVSTISAGDIDQIEGIFTCPINDENKLSDSILECFKSDTTDRRKIFDADLSKRSLDAFINKILKNMD
tara:strand:+ start:5014 stop:6120 length:1107 start_codon:yes stop_codon:yes gene_type:complete